MEEWTGRTTCNEPRNAPFFLRVWVRNVAIVASAKKCHTNEKSIFGTGAGVGKFVRGLLLLLLHLLQAFAQPKQRRKNFNRKSFYFIYSFPCCLNIRSRWNYNTSLVRSQKNIKVTLSGCHASTSPKNALIVCETKLKTMRKEIRNVTLKLNSLL